jgi:DNA polymerase II large subunit
MFLSHDLFFQAERPREVIKDVMVDKIVEKVVEVVKQVTQIPSRPKLQRLIFNVGHLHRG